MSRRARALVVATVVLLSALTGVAVQPALAGSTDGVDASASGGAATDVAAQAAVADANLQSGARFWQGARLRIDASEVVGESGGDRTIELWRVTSDGQLNQRVRTLADEEDGTHVLETGSLAGRFVFRYGDRPVYVHEGTGYLDAPADGGDVTVAGSAFEIRRQTLSVSWTDPTVYPGQATELTVESNRANSVAAVSGSGNVSFSDLEALIPESAYAADYDARADEDVLLVDLGATTRLRLSTAVLAPGDGSLVFDVTDSAARETAALTVLEPDPDRRFRSIERTEQVGDVVEAELDCSHCFLVVGGPDQGFLDVVEVRDSNGDGNVTFRMNTRYAGMFRGASGYPSGVAAYTSPVDSVTRYSPSADLKSVQEALNYDVTTLNDLREQQGLAPSGRDRPIEPGEIRLTVSSSDYVIKRSAYGSGPPLGDGLVVRDETDVETVTLAPRSLDGVATMGAPGDSGFEVTAPSLNAVAGPRDTVALGDRLVFRVDVSGVFGYLATREDDLEALLGNREEGLDLTVERVDGGGSGEVRLNRVASHVVVDPEGDSIYLVLRTGEASSNWLGEGEYRATFSLSGVSAEYDGYSTRDGPAGYPYLQPGGHEAATGTASIAEATASITTPEAGTAPRLDADGGLGVAGTTTIAAGTTLRIMATATEFSWETGGTTTVDTDGTWSTDLPLADAPGEEFEVVVQRGDRVLDSKTYTVRPPQENSTSSESSDGGGGSNGGSSGGGSAAPEEGSPGGLIPGLGGISGLLVPVGAGLGGLVFVWGTWTFVIRRLLL